MFYIYLNASQYDNTLFSLTLFHVLDSALFFTYYFGTLILHGRGLDIFYYGQ